MSIRRIELIRLRIGIIREPCECDIKPPDFISNVVSVTSRKKCFRISPFYTICFVWKGCRQVRVEGDTAHPLQNKDNCAGPWSTGLLRQVSILQANFVYANVNITGSLATRPQRSLLLKPVLARTFILDYICYQTVSLV